jgi:hypothetical protein
MNIPTTVKKILYVVVALGAAYSFFYWLPLTQRTLTEDGMRVAILSSLLPRLILDVATIVVCIMAFRDSSK